MLQPVAKSEATPGLRFKIVEKGGKRLENILSKPKPTSSDFCVRKDQLRKNCVGYKGAHLLKATAQFGSELIIGEGGVWKS